MGNAYLQYELTVEKDMAVSANRVPVNGDAISLVNNAFSFCFKETILLTTGGSDAKHNKYVGQVSTTRRTSTSKHGDFISRFDKIDESEGENGNTSVHPHLIINHDLAANKGKMKGVFPLQHLFGFCKTFKKINKQLGFHLTMKTADL